MLKNKHSFLIVCSFLLAACDSTDPNSILLTGSNNSNEQTPTVTATYTLPTPIVQELAPTYVAAGDELTAYGSGFVPPQYGKTMLRLKGNFTNTKGTIKAIDYTTDTTYANSGKVNFTFEPMDDGSFGSDMGSFNGYVWAINKGNDGAIQEQEEEPAKFAVATNPSVIVSSVHPMKSGCADKILKKTIEGTTIGMDVEIVGLKTPSAMHPITINIVYLDLSTAEEAPCPISQIDLPGCSIGDEDGVHIETRTITEPDQLKFSLNNLDFGALSDNVMMGDAMVSINANDGTTSVSRVITVTVYKAPYIVEYDGTYQVAEIYAPEAVSGCIPGSDYGSSVSYSESHSESRSRSCGISANAGLKIPYISNVLSLGFGMNISASVSSSNSSGLSINRQILPHQYGVVYRQTQRLLRTADLVEYSQCGQRNVIGVAELTDWSWAPDIAITTDGKCPPMPESNLHAAECYINCD